MEERRGVQVEKGKSSVLSKRLCRVPLKKSNDFLWTNLVK